MPRAVVDVDGPVRLVGEVVEVGLDVVLCHAAGVVVQDLHLDPLHLEACRHDTEDARETMPDALDGAHGVALQEEVALMSG